MNRPRILKAKLLQNLLQSHKIRFGGAFKKLIVISVLEIITKKDYENIKQFVLNILDDISDWEICDQLALRVIVNLAVQNQKEMFYLIHQWIKSENKWIRSLAIATIPLYIKAEPTESKICLEFLDKVKKEEDKDVKKSIGLALREITKKDSEEVLNSYGNGKNLMTKTPMDKEIDKRTLGNIKIYYEIHTLVQKEQSW